jgi:dihydroorotase
MNLIYNEQAVLGFDSNFKVMPVLRRETDRMALWEGLKDGTIDTIVSDHRPHDKEEKDVEFDNASFGCINLQTVLPSLADCKEFDLKTVINALAINARKLSEIPFYPIAEGNKADLTIYSTENKWVFTKDMICSQTMNTPFVGKEFNGSVVGIINNGKLAHRD